MFPNLDVQGILLKLLSMMTASSSVLLVEEVGETLTATATSAEASGSHTGAKTILGMMLELKAFYV